MVKRRRRARPPRRRTALISHNLRAASWVPIRSPSQRLLCGCGSRRAIGIHREARRRGDPLRVSTAFLIWRTWRTKSKNHSRERAAADFRPAGGSANPRVWARGSTRLPPPHRPPPPVDWEGSPRAIRMRAARALARLALDAREFSASGRQLRQPSRGASGATTEAERDGRSSSRWTVVLA